MKEKNTNKDIVAYHEAGHAVITRALNEPLYRIDVGDFKGKVIGGTSPEYSYDPDTMSKSDWIKIQNKALILLAGEEAERAFYEWHELDCDEFLSGYLRWAQSGYMSSNGRCFDIGMTIRSALRKFKQTGEAFSGSTDPHSAGNGCLMRLAPVPMYCYPDRKAAIEMSGESARTTHGSLECLEASRLFGAIIFQALAGATKAGTLYGHCVTDLTSPALLAVASGAYLAKSESEIQGSGYVVHSVDADPKLTQVFYWRCLIFRQEQKR